LRFAAATGERFVVETDHTRKWPVLKQFRHLTRADFEVHPVWVQVWTTDRGEPWRDSSDEETFRPWLGSVPVDPERGDFLARAELLFADGSVHMGFMSPIPQTRINDLGFAQPRLFSSNDAMHAFWCGLLRVVKDEIEAFYAAVGRHSDQVFPIRARIEKALAMGTTECVIPGFATTRSGKTEYFK
jgi:hypothetical protein